jgi:hypothetical protein
MREYYDVTKVLRFLNVLCYGVQGLANGLDITLNSAPVCDAEVLANEILGVLRFEALLVF